MNELVPMVVCITFVYGIYRLFELFVRRKERMAIIEKLMSNSIDSDILNKQLNMPLFQKSNASWPIRIGLMLVGIGIGVTIASIVDINMSANGEQGWQMRSAIASLYVACIATFGGLGLIAAYFIERKHNKKDSEIQG
ncbi:DUF6249 domain-containing protein [Dysgonomonas sp. 25]|uniref:DUF6249 domain-containing protein n=1 Tax=Dysgonomonas sp. 25 TaxID=2302933 RepID=UPI0013D4BC72|nr:DUF6249 domain-containing protein [Dysgonomonas sp. 25]NDV68324.1 hypothetical protein [Dysgonomonas sp. 25]